MNLIDISKDSVTDCTRVAMFTLKSIHIFQRNESVRFCMEF